MTAYSDNIAFWFVIEFDSAVCRKEQAVNAKRDYDEQAKLYAYETDYETAYYHWYNDLRRLRKGKAANPNKEAAFKAAFDLFRKEALKRKAEVKRKLAVEYDKIVEQDFRDWLFTQQREADRLMDEG